MNKIFLVAIIAVVGTIVIVVAIGATNEQNKIMHKVFDKKPTNEQIKKNEQIKQKCYENLKELGTEPSKDLVDVCYNYVLNELDK